MAVRLVWPLLLAFAVLLAGCGWHLQGMPAGGGAAKSLPPVRLVADLEQPLARELAASLRARGLLLADAAAEAGAVPAALVLVLDDEQSRRRTASVTADVEAAEFELEELVSYRVLAADGALLAGPDTLRVDRVYRYNQNQVVGSSEEQELLQREMRSDLVRRLLQALGRVAEQGSAAPTPAEAG